MRKKTAYKIARAAIEKEIQLVAFDANLYERKLVRSIYTTRAFKKRERFRKAIGILLEEGGLMSLTDPVFIRYEFKRKSHILVRGRETFYDPETRELLEFDTVAEARSWSVANLGVDPAYEEGGGVQPELESLPLFGNFQGISAKQVRARMDELEEEENE